MKNASLIDRIAVFRIATLLYMAKEKTLQKSAESRVLAKRYVKLALKIGEHYKTKLPEELKHKVCKKCDNFFIPGVNCSVRLASSHGYAAYICECGNEEHVFYKKKRR